MIKSSSIENSTIVIWIASWLSNKRICKTRAFVRRRLLFIC